MYTTIEYKLKQLKCCSHNYTHGLCPHVIAQFEPLSLNSNVLALAQMWSPSLQLLPCLTIFCTKTLAGSLVDSQQETLFFEQTSHVTFLHNEKPTYIQ